MMDSKTRIPLIIAFTVVLVFVISLTATSAYLLLSGIQKVEQVVSENTKKNDIVSEMFISSRLRALSLSQMLLMNDPFERDEEYDRFNAFGTNFIVARNKMREATLSDKEKIIFDEELFYASKIGLIQVEIIENIQEENLVEATRLQTKKSIPLQRKTDELFTQLQTLQREGTAKAVIDAAEEFRGSLYILLTMTVFVLLATMMVARVAVKRAVSSEKENQLKQLELEKRVQERTTELTTAKEQAEQASQTKTDFLSHMSHELRTPLNAILGFSQILQFDRDETLTSEQLKNAIEIQTAGNHLLELINELLDLAQIESGNLELDIEAVSLFDIMTETVTMLEPLAKKRDITIINEIKENTTNILADKLRLKQVLLNIIANAIKYNYENGSVLINVETENSDQLRFFIKDTGQGISEENKERVFDNFERLSSHGGIEGSGIGLSVSRHLIELMQGQIGVDNTKDQGSTFWIELPAK